MKHSLLSFNGIATQKNQTQKSKIVRDLYPFLLFWWVAFLRLDSHWTPVEFQTFPKKGLVSASHKPSSTGKNAQQSPGVHSTSPGSCSVGVFLGRNIWILNQKKKETQGSNVWIIHDSFGGDPGDRNKSEASFQCCCGLDSGSKRASWSSKKIVGIAA